MSKILFVSLSINLTEDVCQKQLKGSSAKQITWLQTSFSGRNRLGHRSFGSGEHNNTSKTDPLHTHRSVLGVFWAPLIQMTYCPIPFLPKIWGLKESNFLAEDPSNAMLVGLRTEEAHRVKHSQPQKCIPWHAIIASNQTGEKYFSHNNKAKG